MIKQIARQITPGVIRRWFQQRKLRRLVNTFVRRVVEHRYGDLTLKVELADPLAVGWYDHDWAPLPELDVLGGRRLRAGARVFDIGAHQGVVGLMLAHRVGPTGQVVVVEPNPHNVAMCGRNAELNGMTWVVPHQAAISDRPGVLRFNSGLNGQAAELSDYGGVFEVPAVTVDDLTDRYGPPDVVFVDVEGFECRALAGAGRTFAGRPDWFVEVHVGSGLEAAGGSAARVVEFFPAAEFDCFVHSEGDTRPVPLAEASAEKLAARFFLTALSRTPAHPM